MQTRSSRFAFSLLIVPTIWCAVISQAASLIEFNRDIRPILSENCFQCHGPDAENRKAGLRLDTENGAKKESNGVPAVLEGNPQDSELIRRINHSAPDEQMPPLDSNKRLSPEQKALLSQWILEGAAWDDHWSFIAPVRPQLPVVKLTSWPKNEIDHFVLARLETKNLTPSPDTTREILIRRLSLDLTGLPPSISEVDDFLTDTRPDAYEYLVERLLRSPRYGEHMAWQWLDAARYADTDGYQNDGPRDMWRWRDWVINAYNENHPFDRFTIEQLAGDLLPEASTNQIIATGFNRNHRYNSESGLVFEEFLLENAVDRVDTSSTVWMGLTTGCARCHDHKYDPLSQKEYYQLIAYFNNVPESGRAIKFGNSEPWIKAPTIEQHETLSQLQQAIAEAEKSLENENLQIASLQQEWEHTFNSAAPELPLLPNGLNHHFAPASAIKASKDTRHEFEKIPNLICNGRFSIAFQLTPEIIDRGAVLSNETAGTGRNGILVEFHNGHLRFHIISRWIAGVAGLETIETLSSNIPVHVTLTNDGTQRSKGMRIYLNGKQAPTKTLFNSNSNKSPENFGDVMRFGFSPHVDSWKGLIQDLRFYNRQTLTPSAVMILAEQTSIATLISLPPNDRTATQKAKLRSYFLSHAAPDEIKKRHLTLIQRRADHLKYYDSLPTTMVMEESEHVKETHLRKRGVYHQKGETVQRGTPKILSPMPETYPRNRLGFAKWLVDGRNPLTARVTVNRYWQQLFGRGLVKTPEDFGAQGSLPSHPKLLDWLASEFVDKGWDTQHILKKIVTSATYRQSSRITNTALTEDPQNVLLGRAPRRRLPGNILRDQALLVSGLLVEKEGGPSVKPFQPEQLWSEASNFTYKMGEGSDLYRRSLYTYWKRTLAPPSMALLDTADREWCSVRPKQTNTPLQALTLLNEQAFIESAIALGSRIHQTPGSLRNKLILGFRMTTTRSPNGAELATLEQSFERYRNAFERDPTALKQLLATATESTETALSSERAAMITLANVLLNLDETTTRE